MAPRSFPVRVTSVRHPSAEETHVFIEIGSRVFADVVPIDRAPRASCVCSIGHPDEPGCPDPGDLPGCVRCPVHGPFYETTER